MTNNFKNIRKILVIRLSAIGDVLRTLPALKALRNNFPDAFIGWVVEEGSRDILEVREDLDRLYIFRRKKWKNFWKGPHNFLNIFSEFKDFIGELRKENFDLAIDFHGIFKSGIITYLSGAKVRVGFSFKDSKEFNYLFTNKRVMLPDYRMKRSDRNLKLLEAIGLNVENSDPEIFTTSKDERFVDDFFEKNNYTDTRPLIAIHPGSSLKTGYKRWPSDKYAELADLLIGHFKAQVVITWNGDEKKLAEEIKDGMRNNPIIANKGQTLSQLAELLKRCDLYIGGDTAPMHLAALVGTPVLALFGPTDPVTNAPFCKTSYKIIRKDLSCSPCRNRNCKNLDCMDKITTEQVYESAREMLMEKRFY